MNMMSKVLLLYFVLCSGFYDPVVLVDDTPRTPLFKEILKSSSAQVFNNTIRKTFFKDKISHGGENVFHPMSKVLLSLCLIFLTYFYFSFFCKQKKISHSILIRGPSTFS